MDTPAKPATPRRISGKSHHAKPKAPRATEGRLPIAPPELGPSAAAEWARIAAKCMALGMLPDLDRSTFAMYCTAVGDYTDCRNEWTAAGSPFTVDRPSGARAHPMLAVMHAIGADVSRLAHQLGMTPRARKVLSLDMSALANAGGDDYDGMTDPEREREREIGRRYFDD